MSNTNSRLSEEVSLSCKVVINAALRWAFGSGKIASERFIITFVEPFTSRFIDISISCKPPESMTSTSLSGRCSAARLVPRWKAFILI